MLGVHVCTVYTQCKHNIVFYAPEDALDYKSQTFPAYKTENTGVTLAKKKSLKCRIENPKY